MADTHQHAPGEAAIEVERRHPARPLFLEQRGHRRARRARCLGPTDLQQQRAAMDRDALDLEQRQQMLSMSMQMMQSIPPETWQNLFQMFRPAPGR